MREELVERGIILSSLEKKIVKIVEFIDFLSENFPLWDDAVRNNALSELLKRKQIWTDLTPEILTALYTLDKSPIEFLDLSDSKVMEMFQTPQSASSQKTFAHDLQKEENEDIHELPEFVETEKLALHASRDSIANAVLCV